MSESSTEWPVPPSGTKVPSGPRRDFEVEDIGSLALIEDEEDLRKMAVASIELKVDHLVDAGFEEGALLVGHRSTRCKR